MPSLGAASALPAAVFIHGGSHTRHTCTCGHKQPLGTHTLVHRGHMLVSVYAEAAPRSLFTAGLQWAARHRHLPALQYPSLSVLAQALLSQTHRTCYRQICPCQAHMIQETNLIMYFVPLDPNPCIPIRCTGHINDHRFNCTCFHPSIG